MDVAHFGSLASRLAARLTRRRSLGLFSGLGLGSAAAPLDTDARKRKKKKPKACSPCKKRKKGKCKANLPDNTACAGGGSCQSGRCVAPVQPAGCGAGGPCLVFLSSTFHNGNLGGIDGADAKCQSAATAASLPGTYKAWLSDSFSDSAPATRFTHSTGPYRLVNGATVAANWDDLTDGVLTASINVTEKGGVVTASNEAAWTNTLRDGTRHGDPSHCDNWQTNTDIISGHMGLVTSTTHTWTETSPVTCQSHAPLYCFQQS